MDIPRYGHARLVRDATRELLREVLLASSDLADPVARRKAADREVDLPATARMLRQHSEHAKGTPAVNAESVLAALKAQLKEFGLLDYLHPDREAVYLAAVRKILEHPDEDMIFEGIAAGVIQEADCFLRALQEKDGATAAFPDVLDKLRQDFVEDARHILTKLRYHNAGFSVDETMQRLTSSLAWISGYVGAPRELTLELTRKADAAIWPLLDPYQAADES